MSEQTGIALLLEIRCKNKEKDKEKEKCNLKEKDKENGKDKEKGKTRTKRTKVHFRRSQVHPNSVESTINTTGTTLFAEVLNEVELGTTANLF